LRLTTPKRSVKFEEDNKGCIAFASTEHRLDPRAGVRRRRGPGNFPGFHWSGGLFRPPSRPSSTFEFSGQKTRKYRKVWRVDLWTKFIRSSENFSCSFFSQQKKIRMRFFFCGKKNFFFFFHKIFRKFRKKVKKTEKIDFFRKRQTTRISREWCRFFVKRWDLEHLFGGGGYPHFSEYTKDRDPLFWGSFFDPFFRVFSRKKNIFGSKNFFRDEKKIKFFFHRRKKNP
jgi:hypothetical protein